MNKRILLVDDDHMVIELLTIFLDHAGYGVDSAADGIECLKKLQDGQYDLIILDICMPKMNGMEVLRFVKRYYPRILVIMISGITSERVVDQSKSMGAYACIQKPFTLDDIHTLINDAIINDRELQMAN